MKKRLLKKMYRRLAALSAAEKKDYPADGQCLYFFCGQSFPGFSYPFAVIVVP